MAPSIDPAIGRHLDDADGELERGLLRSLYRSGEQRRRRTLLWSLLLVKHVLRGVLFSWPLYVLASASLLLPDGAGMALAVMFVPALLVSGWILWRGIDDDRAAYLDGVVLRPGAIWRIVTGQRA